MVDGSGGTIEPVDVRFYVFTDSYPCEAVLAAARHKEIDVRRVDLAPVLHAFVMKAVFGERTVPGARFGDRKVHGSTAIFHALDGVRPDPPLFPTSEVEAAEAWGAGPFQDIGRRFVWFHLRGRPAEMRRWAQRDEDPRTARMKRVLGAPMAAIAARANDAAPERVRADLAALPEHLAHVDELIARGVIGNPGAPNAADFQILSSVAAWWVIQDLRPLLSEHDSVSTALRLFPRYAHTDGFSGGVIPPAWLEPPRAV